ncbi:MATE family efflux transporter [Facklamia miroungae]|uniref:Putative efflux protein, MATE family n=1 Tax=Facklamia miroungae TaxID=120956 RepID=A0A1G7Q9V3_9LACT|nr:MATE family efflux transporter [Facklamia miroungae]NKZ28873.1 MATE family efflux transporter [Facklamia miroungae]SDF95296.1 putative efflux protein, MATE family [Facklamia miroungae]
MSLVAKKLKNDYFHLLWPLLIEQVFMMLIGNVNIFLYSRYNDQVVAAIGIADQILVIGTMAMGIVSLGSTILFLQNAADDQLPYLRGVVRQSVFLNMILGLIIVLVALFLGREIMSWMQTPKEILGASILYFRMVSLSLIFQAISTSAAALLRAFGKVKLSMGISIINTLLIITGNALVVLTPFSLFGEGIFGLSVATIITRIVGAVFSIVCIKQILPQVWQGIFTFNHKDWQIGQRILALGVPSGMENVSYNFSQTIITAVIASLGTAQISARIYTQTLTAIVFTLSVAAGQAGQVILGRLSRKKELKEAQTFSLNNMFLFMGIGASINLVIALVGPWILQIFTSDPEIIHIARILLWMNVLYDPLRAGNEIIIASLNVMGEVRYPVYMALLVTYLFTVPGSVLVGSILEWGIIFIWIIFILDEGIRLGLFVRRWQRGEWMQHAKYF